MIEFRDVSQQKAMEEERVEALVIEEQLRARAEHDKMLRGQMSDFVDYVSVSNLRGGPLSCADGSTGVSRDPKCE